MISTTSEYALRALVVLAGEDEGAAMQARELARMTEISPSYLYKILASLRRSGLLAGTRGSRGGYSLARSADDMRLIDVVSLFENVRPKGACLLSDTRICNDDNPCGAHEHWKRVQRNYYEFLESRTIADLSTKGCH
jgi:Rrf2 family iron-sulfur cluster assembly transcriptional regulator